MLGCLRALVPGAVLLAAGLATVLALAAAPAGASVDAREAPDVTPGFLGAAGAAAAGVSAPTAHSAGPPPPPAPSPTPPPRLRAPVVVDGRTLFEVGPSGPYTAEDRACLVARDVSDAIAAGHARLEAGVFEAMPTIRMDGRHLLSVTPDDVMPGRTPEEQMSAWWRAIDDALARGRIERSAGHRLRAGLLSAAALAGAALLHFALRRLVRRIPVWSSRRRGGVAAGGHAESPGLARALELAVLPPQAAAWIAALAFAVERFPAARAARARLGDALARSVETPLFQLGARFYTAEDLLVLPLLLGAVWLGVTAVTRLLAAPVLMRAGVERGVQERILALVRWPVAFVGGLVVLQLQGIDVSSIAIVASVLGVGIGFGLQHIANNLMSGLLITFERPVQPGDFVKVGDSLGTVTRVGGRSTQVRTLDNVTILVPNSRFLENEVVNYSHGDPTTRLHVPVGVAYGSDLAAARAALLGAARSHPAVLADPPPQVQLTGFGESSLDLDLLVWTRDPRNQLTLRSDLYFRIEAGLRRAGVTIPFPQRDLHLRSEAIDGLAAAAAKEHYGVEVAAATSRAAAGTAAAIASDAAWRGAFDAQRSVEAWTEEQLAALVARMGGPGGVDVADRRHLLTVYPRCVVGRDVVDWLVRSEGLTRSEAVEVGRLLVTRGQVRHVLDEHGFEDGGLFYRFGSGEERSIRDPPSRRE